MLHIQPLFRVMSLMAIFAMIPGCGPDYPETIPVSGTVTLDGQPVAGAAVVFTPEEGQKATGTTDASGRFELSSFQLGDGAVPGRHRVTVAKTTVDSGDEEKVVFLIPQEYGNLQTSELVCDVQKEMGPVQFNLETPASPPPEPAQAPLPEKATDSPETDEPSPQTPPATEQPSP